MNMFVFTMNSKLLGEIMLYDVVIIGAGISGTMLARELSRYRLHVAVLDKENDIANETTMANSAIVHTGYDPDDGTLKAKLNVSGAILYNTICDELNCKIKNVGSFVVACGKEEESHLGILADRAKRRGISFEFLGGNQARALEPNLSDSVTKVLSFPGTSVIYPWEVAIACMQVAVNNGTELYLNHEVNSISKNGATYIIKAGDDEFETKMIINASGTGAAKISNMISPEATNFEVIPKRGEYYVISNDVHIVDHVIFPVPTSKGKGVLAIPTVYGNTLIGPNSEPLEHDANVGTSAAGAKYIQENISKIIKNVPIRKSIRTFAGLRPSTTSKDFIIEPLKDNENFINVASIESPGLASAPAIALYAIENYVMPALKPEINEKAVMTRSKPLVIADLSDEERDEAVKKNPQFANMVCRCEKISEGEIVAAIHDSCGARSVKGVKKRVRPGMGKCQGGFCEPKVVAILARELGISPVEVVLDGQKSQILEKENR